MEQVIPYYNLCTTCGTCRVDCTIFKIKKLDSSSPRARIMIAGLIKQGMLDPKTSQKIIETFFTCTLCSMCLNACPSGVDVPKIVKSVRSYLIEQGLSPEPVNMLIETVKKTKNIFDLDDSERLSWSENVEEIIKDKINKPSELAFYVGCQESFKGSLSMIPESMVKIMAKAGVDFTLLGEHEWCCGNPAFLIGDISDPIKEIAQHNVKKMEELGVKKVVVTCPGCYRAWTVAYPQVLGIKKLPFEIIHSTELITELIKSGKIKIGKPYPKKVGYQDPCELGRISGIFEAPREILKAIPEVAFIELDANKMEASCCGGGGLCKASYDPVATEIASRKIDEFKAAGVEVITTACPACYDNLAVALRTKQNIELQDLHELIADLME